MATDSTESALRLWMTGAVSEHPLHHPGIPTRFLEVLNEILQSLSIWNLALRSPPSPLDPDSL
jgi:hypothetical protein